VTGTPPSKTELLLDLLGRVERHMARLESGLSELYLRMDAVENATQISVSMLRRSAPQFAQELAMLRIEPNPDTPAAAKARAQLVAAQVRRLLIEAGAPAPVPAPEGEPNRGEAPAEAAADQPQLHDA
jgi:hypothetical protein